MPLSSLICRVASDCHTGPERARIFGAHYYVKGGGNCDLSQRSDPHEEFEGVNVLIARKTLEETARLAGGE